MQKNQAVILAHLIDLERFELYRSFSKKNRNSFRSKCKSIQAPISTSYSTLWLLVTDYGTLSLNIQHRLNWGRKEFLANFYCQYVDKQINLKFMRPVSERERAIRQLQIDVSF